MNIVNRYSAHKDINELETPKFGELVSISDGVLWTRLTIPSKLDHINIYLIEDVGGWLAVDTGPDSDINRKIWKKIVRNLPGIKKLSGLLVTHCHPDHIGLSGWMQNYFGIPVFISESEILKARNDEFNRLSGDNGRVEDFYISMGVTSSELPEFKRDSQAIAHLYGALPDQVEIFSKGQSINVGGNYWDIWSGSGHSVEHLCIKNEDKNIFVSGDQVLPNITPHVGLGSTNFQFDPLKRWIDSLSDLKSWVSPDVLTLPAHEKLFFDVKNRIDVIIDHHHKFLERMNVLLDQWITTYELINLLGWGGLKGFGRCLAFEETFAHLVFLVNSGKVQVQERELSGAMEFRSSLVEK